MDNEQKSITCTHIPPINLFLITSFFFFVDEGLLEVVQWIGRALLHRLRERLYLQDLELQGGK